MLERAQLRQLVLRQRLRRIQEERPLLWVLEEALQDGQVVAERLAARGRRDHDEVPTTLTNSRIGFGLVGVEPLDPTPGQGGHQLGSEIYGQRRRSRRGFRNHVVQRYLPLKVVRVE